MNIYKLKSLFLSLATVVCLSILLSSCSQDDLVQDMEQQLNVQSEVVDELESRSCNSITALNFSSVSYKAATGRTITVEFYNAFGKIGEVSFTGWACKPYTKSLNLPLGTCRVKAKISGTVQGSSGNAEYARC